LRVTISKGSPAHHAFMTTVIGAVMVGLEPVVFLLCGIYAGTVYGGIVGALRGAREPRLDVAPAIVRSRAA
jgi:hypothetical protein